MVHYWYSPYGYVSIIRSSEPDALTCHNVRLVLQASVIVLLLSHSGSKAQYNYLQKMKQHPVK